MPSERTYETAEKRWASVGPYYAMFPIAFADKVVGQYTQVGDVVLDPFAGRGTSIFSAASQGRMGVGIELNPVGWLYARAKLSPASQAAVERRIEELGRSGSAYGLAAVSLSTFFRLCFSVKVRQFLCAARDLLKWRTNQVDRTIMALILVYLHGKREASLSNQLRQAKAMAPDYAVRWWQARDLRPPDIDPVDFLVRRLTWRYAKGRPKVTRSKVYLGDCTKRLPEVERRVREGRIGRPRLLLTSPPYYAVTNYHYDQWLRLWMLGGPPNARRVSKSGKYAAKFENWTEYFRLLTATFRSAKEFLSRDAVIYVRTDRRPDTFEATLDLVKAEFPRKRVTIKDQPFLHPTQTHLFGDSSEKVGEADIVLR